MKYRNKTHKEDYVNPNVCSKNVSRRNANKNIKYNVIKKKRILS